MKKIENLKGPGFWPLSYWGLLFTSLCWATVGTHVRAMKGLNPFLITLSRLVYSEILVLGILFILILMGKTTWKKFWDLFDWRNLPSWYLSFILVIYYFLAVWAFQHISLPIGALLVGAAPFWTLVFRFILRDKISFWHFMAFFITMLGLSGITLLKESGAGSLVGFQTTNLGIFLALMSSLCTATSSQLASFYHREHKHYSPLSVTLKVFFLGLPLLFLFSPLLISELETKGELYKTFHLNGLFFTLTIIGTLIPTFLFSSYSKLVKSTVATSFLQLIPLWTLFYAKYFFNEVPTLWQMISMMVLFIGLIWTLKLNSRQ